MLASLSDISFCPIPMDRPHSIPTGYPFTPGWEEAMQIKCLPCKLPVNTSTFHADSDRFQKFYDEKGISKDSFHFSPVTENLFSMN